MLLKITVLKFKKVDHHFYFLIDIPKMGFGILKLLILCDTRHETYYIPRQNRDFGTLLFIDVIM